MELGLLAHRAALNDCYALNETQLEISLRTGYEVDHVYLCYGDPFSAGIMGGSEKWSGERIEITECRYLAYQKRWTVTIEPPYRRCKYYFELHAKEECVFFFEDGCYTRDRMAIPGRKEQCFFFPWMNPSDVNETPKWVEDTIWYQIFPDRFYNADHSLDPSYVKKWKCERTGHLDVYGGDLRGIRQKIPYLRELGITGIYLTPIFESNSNHKYNTTDYYKIDKCFGEEQELINLVKEAHASGIRIMLDAVFNHCGNEFAPWQDVLKNGPESIYYDWFFIQKWPFNKADYSTRDGKFFSFAFYGEMPKLNTNNPEVIRYFTKLCSFWLKNWDIDGIRFDVGNEVSHTFLKELRKTVKEIKPDVYLLGEIWHDSILWLQGDEYDSVMNYPLVESINDFFIDESRTAFDFECSMNRCYSLYGKQTNRVLFNLLDSHDTERLYTRTGSLGRFYQQLAVLFTMQGSPCIYYGTEIVMEGAHDPDCRRCMPWTEIEAGAYTEKIDYMKKLIQIRKEYDACKGNQIVWHSEKDRVIHYEKKMENAKTIGVLLNASDESICFPKGATCLFSYGCKNQLVPKDSVLIYQVNE